MKKGNNGVVANENAVATITYVQVADEEGEKQEESSFDPAGDYIVTWPPFLHYSRINKYGRTPITNVFCAKKRVGHGMRV